MSNQNDTDKIFLVTLSYDQKYVMDLEGVTAFLTALTKSSKTFKAGYGKSADFEMSELDIEITVRVVSKKRLNELALENTLTKGNTP